MTSTFTKKLNFTLPGICVAVMFMVACGSSTSANDEEETENQERTFDLVLSADESTKIGTVTTREITESDDAYIDDGFFITLTISTSDFEGPFDINMVDSDSHCGTFNVQPGDKAEMPCTYSDFLNDPAGLTVTAEDGDGAEANPVSG